ncbi:bacteriohemerythrin [Diaphorobacter sp. HDW4A]|uniref:bacteriohemerythrin n=1 Tax=Diaphorobacter sp. HDW4A TaxID=2714924 RepID=UPI00140969B7|nr:bacteriohemerythrin [Diaphorobacter sp. HDW4A]QIL81714.1 bacteriohemerythrin [Diaphorobacter sp. HDW4A]
MTLMPWSEQLELGIAEIDTQHRVLVDLANALHDEIHGASPRCAVIGQILESLVDYTHNHFIMEEVLFHKYGYAQVDAHEAEHSGFTGKIMDLLTRFEDGDTVGQETLEVLKDWLTHHICVVDRAYLPFMSAALASEAAAESVPG